MFWLVSTIATTANIRIWSKYITENSVPNEYIYISAKKGNSNKINR